MIKGFRFTNQLANAEVDARIHQEFLNRADGVFYGMELSKTTNAITVGEGLCEIAGRPVAIIGNETVTTSTESLYCLLILEVDLSKETTKDIFNQVTFKVLTSSTAYPTVTQQDINKYNGTDKLYQLEFARFKTGTNGITEFKDTRKFLNFNGIYGAMQKEYRELLQQLKQELVNVENGSTYMLNKVDVANITLKGNGSVKMYIQFKRSGNVVCVKVRVYVASGVTADATMIDITSLIPNFAKTKEKVASGECFSLSACENQGLKTSITKESNGTYYFNTVFSTKAENQSKHLENYMTYIVDDEIVTENDYILGDVNGDGIVNSYDANLVTEYIMGEISFTEKQFKAADMNKDGEITPSDYVILCNKIADMYQKGDVNTDGIVDSKDLELVQKHLTEELELNQAQKKLADVNGDETIDTADILKLSQYIQGIIPSLD